MLRRSLRSFNLLVNKSKPSFFGRKYTTESVERIGETWKYQDSLPLLPLPTVQSTCENYRRFLAPLLTEEEFSKENEIINKFESSQLAVDLHAQLLEIQSRSDSWLEGFWDDMYLKLRDPLTINTNPFIIIKNIERTEKYGQAAEILYSLFKFKKLIRDRKLTPDKEGDEPLCMSQYAKLFGCNRYPKPNRDVLSFNRYARHVIVLRNGYFFTLAIENENEQFLQPEMIRKRLQLICEKADQLPSNDNFIGLFTSANRDVWAEAYSSLQKFSDKNKKNLDAIAGAAFVLNLDNQSVDLHSEDSSKLFLHNFGKNRWFDKLQLIVTENGVAGFNMEHSPFDGHTLLRVTTDIYNDILKTKEIPLETQNILAKDDGCPLPVQLEWELNETVVQSLQKVRSDLETFCNSTYTLPVTFPDAGKSLLKKLQVSPDGFVQMAIQLSYYLYSNKFVSTYESAMTKKFLQGRTETIRTVSNESIAYCKQFNLNNLAQSGKLLLEATKRHSITAKDAKNGLACDRHLFGLYNIAKLEKERYPDFHIPPIFTSPNYAAYMSNIISTSNCSAEALELFGFGPVHQDGIGVGYIIRNDATILNLSSFNKDIYDIKVKLIEAFNLQLKALEAYSAKK